MNIPNNIIYISIKHNNFRESRLYKKCFQIIQRGMYINCFANFSTGNNTVAYFYRRKVKRILEYSNFSIQIIFIRSIVIPDWTKIIKIYL